MHDEDRKTVFLACVWSDFLLSAAGHVFENLYIENMFFFQKSLGWMFCMKTTCILFLINFYLHP